MNFLIYLDFNQSSAMNIFRLGLFAILCTKFAYILLLLNNGPVNDCEWTLCFYQTGNLQLTTQTHQVYYRDKFLFMFSLYQYQQVSWISFVNKFCFKAHQELTCLWKITSNTRDRVREIDMRLSKCILSDNEGLNQSQQKKFWLLVLENCLQPFVF